MLLFEDLLKLLVSSSTFKIVRTPINGMYAVLVDENKEGNALELISCTQEHMNRNSGNTIR